MYEYLKERKTINYQVGASVQGVKIEPGKIFTFYRFGRSGYDGEVLTHIIELDPVTGKIVEIDYNKKSMKVDVSDKFESRIVELEFKRICEVYEGEYTRPEDKEKTQNS